MKRNPKDGRSAWFGVPIVLALLLPGCGSPPAPVYQGKEGFRFTPPPGWVERARDDLFPKSAQKQSDLPLPPLGLPDSVAPDKLMVRYDRTIAGHSAWIRVSSADVPAATPLNDCVSTRSPGADWKAESAVEKQEVGGMPAARVAFTGRWHDQDYISETVAVRHKEQVYFITASFPAADATAREQARQAVARATWK